MELFIVYCLLFILGTSVGSFLNVVIDRLETGESILTSRSHCDHCQTSLHWYDLIPIVSFLWLRGKCRYCGVKLRLQYPLVEIATGVIFVLGFLRILSFGFRISDFGFFTIIASAMIVIFVYDLKHKIIPDKIVLPAIGVVLLFHCFMVLWLGNTFSNGTMGQWSNYLFSAIGAGSFFLCLIIATRGRGMGLGDVKLGFLMGLILGWPGILIALYLSFISGALVGLFLIAAGKKRFGQEIPFGPFLSASTIATLLYGDYLLHLIVVASPASAFGG